MKNKMKFHWINRLGAATFFTLLVLLTSTSAKAQDGKALYKANCAACHKEVKNSTGPMLQGAKARWEEAGEAENLYKWVKDPAALVSSGTSPRAIEMEGFSPAPMPPQNLTNEEIDAIFKYADDYVVAVKPSSDATTAGAGEEEGDNSFLLMVILAVVLGIVFFSVIGVRRQLKYVEEGADYEMDMSKTNKDKLGEWIVRNWQLTLILFLIVVVTGGADMMSRANQVGVFEDYEPSQSIAYSHKLHAGDMGIDCKYCHNSAEKSKHAGIPTVNVCMNCHENVLEGTTTGTSEIAKIHAAAGFDADTKTYSKETSPIIWNKAHNLPDHVYFSHAQHTNPKTGGVDCKQCHGDVQTFGLGRVASTEEINKLAGTDGVIALTKPLLTMGWCLECHNEKTVDLTRSDYYEELHDRLGSRPDFLRRISEDDKITVRELGGWECAKCHY